ncbi:FAD-dependent monooxygenase [Hazenella sp. IB182353]|uniref:FAD-dependent monooxygenase n=1 Tax=Polycladospora coralii TaxID=2771432 RepID=UPI001747B742|nr:FAD-dependent monooxygenase [Polycladospora coralii]MBS7530903.1 FAD-dependent monooxygenase [Polycladospora coralii]
MASFIIIGAGIGGLTAANALMNTGHEVHVYESYPKLKPSGMGITLAPNAFKALSFLNFVEDIKKVGKPLDSFQIRSETGNLLSAIQSNENITMAFHRADLYVSLFQRLPNGIVSFNKKCVDFKQDQNGVKVTFADGSHTKGDYLLGVDGIHSMIRQKIAPSISPQFAGYTCWRGISKRGDILKSPNIAMETWGPNGRFGIVPLRENQIYWFAVTNAAENSKRMKKYSKSDLVLHFEGYHEPITQIIEQTEEEAIVRNDLYDLPKMNRYAYDRILLMGDAAHAMTPNLGQGACQAMEDVAVLSMCMKRQLPINEAFVAFEKERIKRVQKIVDRSRLMGRVGQMNHPVARKLRNGIMTLIPDRLRVKQIDELYQI